MDWWDLHLFYEEKKKERKYAVLSSPLVVLECLSWGSRWSNWKGIGVLDTVLYLVLFSLTFWGRLCTRGTFRARKFCYIPLKMIPLIIGTNDTFSPFSNLSCTVRWGNFGQSKEYFLRFSPYSTCTVGTSMRWRKWRCVGAREYGDESEKTFSTQNRLDTAEIRPIWIIGSRNSSCSYSTVWRSILVGLTLDTPFRLIKKGSDLRILRSQLSKHILTLMQQILVNV